MNNEQLDLASIYGIPSCAGGDCSPGAVFTPTNPSPSTPGNRIPTLEEIAGYNIQNPKIPAPLPQIQPTPGQSVPMTGSNVGEYANPDSLYKSSGAADAYQPAAAYLRRKPAIFEWISANSAGKDRHGGIPGRSQYPCRPDRRSSGGGRQLYFDQ